VVTGACSGIGLAIARALAERGYDLCVCSDRAGPLAEASRAIREEFHCEVREVVLDLSDADSARALHAQATEGGRAVDALVSNAGVFFFGEVADADPERARRMLGLHVVVPSLLCTYFARDLRAQGRGRVMLVSSISAWRDFPGIAYYASSKKYLRGFARALRCELAVYGVSVTCLSPGATATGLYSQTGVPVGLATRLGVMMSAERVAREGVEAMLRGDAECVPGAVNRVVTSAVGLVPQGAIDALRRYGPWLRRE
jgi:short-subunit dehydrogenase